MLKEQGMGFPGRKAPSTPLVLGTCLECSHARRNLALLLSVLASAFAAVLLALLLLAFIATATTTPGLLTVALPLAHLLALAAAAALETTSGGVLSPFWPLNGWWDETALLRAPKRLSTLPWNP